MSVIRRYPDPEQDRLIGTRFYREDRVTVIWALAMALALSLLANAILLVKYRDAQRHTLRDSVSEAHHD